MSVGDDHYKGFNSVTAICLKSDLYLRYRVDDLLTPYQWSCLDELCMNFVCAFQTQSIILKMMNVVLYIGFSVISGKAVVYLDKKIKGSKLDLTLVRFVSE